MRQTSWKAKGRVCPSLKQFNSGYYSEGRLNLQRDLVLMGPGKKGYPAISVWALVWIDPRLGAK